MNTTAQKNELIFGYSSGKLGEAKSLFTSMYLYLNSIAKKKALVFDNMLAENLSELKDVKLTKLKYTDCIQASSSKKSNENSSINPLSRLVGNLNNVDWNSVYKGFKEFNIPVNDSDSVKLIKMDPGTSVPLHSHNGKEYILVLEGSFCDEYGEYKKGDMQINDHQIKHNPTSCNSDGCVCLSITENDVIFFGKFGSVLNLFTFIKSFFK
ncbi:cupin domain-containing protein [Alphaproteobacteria bacterium]|nr:cupin domain-containing protein [Alphaproteobacteria bacterium]